MKIGIVTFHRSHNYGALLQTYALKLYLESLGVDVDIVDYWPPYHKREYTLIPHFEKMSLKGKIKSILIFIMSLRRILTRRLGYTKFIKKQLKVKNSSGFEEITQERILNSNYDMIIYGSDQIWRKNVIDGEKKYDYNYFGQNNHIVPKVSYAASMGVIDLDEGELDIIKSLLLEFRSISVREEPLESIIKERLKLKVSLVLDPVFLLDKKFWFHKIGRRIIKHRYLFYYNLIKSQDTDNLVNQIAKTDNLIVIEIQGRINTKKFLKRFRAQLATPFDFINLINFAEVVVSTSFHGVAFSLIFEKQFYASGMKQNADRVKSLLKVLNIGDRYIYNTLPKGKIDYTKVNELLGYHQSNSKMFLKNSINEVTLS